MICKNCKQENPDNIKFCPHCGTKVEQGEEVNGDKVDTLLKDNMLNKSKTILKRMNKKVWLAIGFVMIVFLVMIMGVNNKTIDLNKYVTIEVTGYDTVAKAIVTFDENSFKQDYSDKLSYNEDNVFGVLYTPTNYVLECISWELNQETNLTNGDTITLTWDCLDDLVYNNFGYKLKYKDISYKVKGLEKVDTFNPFDSITVEFSGVSPYGTVAIHNNMEAEVASNLYVEADVKSGLRMKDIITVTISTKDGSDICTYFNE